MNRGFWDTLSKPIMALAPMADVTDAAFRRIIAKYGKPDVTWTEFVSADGLCSQGREVLLRDLAFSDAERPIVAQLFTSNPEHMRRAAALCAELGFDGVDINMGCPDKSIEKQGCGAAMIRNPDNALAVVRAAKDGAAGLPVSVKTRLGYNKDELEEWLPRLLETEPAAITIHARTRKEMSLVPARWERVARAVEIAKGSGTLILGNGDVKSVEEGRRLTEETGADGVMIGRGIFGNPWLFAKDGRIPPLYEKLKVMVEHTQLFEELLGDIKNFAIMKKHYKAYVNGFDGAKELRMMLMEAKDAAEVKEITQNFLTER